MSRSGYSEDGCGDQWADIRWRGAVKAALRGKRGQAFLREFIATLDAMPVKRLAAEAWVSGEDACALGVVARARGFEKFLESLDPDDDFSAELIAPVLDIAPAMAREIIFTNDDAAFWEISPEGRWTWMRQWAEAHLRKDTP
jgi:hypothetical protein